MDAGQSLKSSGRQGEESIVRRNELANTLARIIGFRVIVFDKLLRERVNFPNVVILNYLNTWSRRFSEVKNAFVAQTRPINLRADD